MHSERLTRSMWIAAVLGFLGCATDALPEDDGSETAAATTQALELRVGLPFTEIPAPAGQPEMRVLIASTAVYMQLFHQRPPPDVNFFAGDALIFYSAGVQTTGGYQASIESIVVDAFALRVTTRLESPGPDCLVTESLTNPRTMVKFRKPFALRRARFASDDTVRDCSSPSCDDIECPVGQHCELEEVVCIKAPCNPIPTCVDDPKGPFCGGIAGIPCPGSGTCIDDASDDCDPKNGGADCGGICVCAPQTIACPLGYRFDDSPDVCTCLPPAPSPCAAVLCEANSTCIVDPDGKPQCVPSGGERCGQSVCGPGTSCCNASCGICTPPGTFCIQIACEATL